MECRKSCLIQELQEADYCIRTKNHAALTRCGAAAVGRRILVFVLVTRVQ